MKNKVSTPPLQACRICEHGRKLHELKNRASETRARCEANHLPAYRQPEHEHDDQHGYHRHCADFKMRAEVIDADEEDGA